MENSFIEINNLSYKYKKTGFDVEIDSLSFSQGEITCLAGHNGSGKTTLTKLILGILPSKANTILVDGQDISTLRLCEVGKKIGYLFQNPDRQLFCLTAKDEIVFSIKVNGVEEGRANKQAVDMLESFSMGHLSEKYPLFFSRGEKQRLAILATLALKPKYFILDEPSSGLDATNKQKLIDMLMKLKDDGIGVLIITHDNDLIKICDSMVKMSKGRVVSI